MGKTNISVDSDIQTRKGVYATFGAVDNAIFQKQGGITRIDFFAVDRKQNDSEVEGFLATRVYMSFDDFKTFIDSANRYISNVQGDSDGQA